VQRPGCYERIDAAGQARHRVCSDGVGQ
jgi:hypothetical protein